jgi:hypothetical protein
MPSEYRLNRQLWDHQQRLVEQAMPANARNISFEIISDDHAANALSPESQATFERLRRQATERAERQILEQLQAAPPSFISDEGSNVDFSMEYLNNSWGDFAETERRVSESLRSNREPPVPEDRSFRMNTRGTVTGRMSSNPIPAAARPSARLAYFDRAVAERQLIDQGYDDYAVVLEIPGPFADAQTVGVLECVRQNPGGPAGHVQRRYFSFARITANDYQILNIKSEAEYVSDLRRRSRDVSHFYNAQADGRRRMAAKILSGGADTYQLLLTAVVDDDDLRNNLSSREYRRKMASHEERVKAAGPRLAAFKRQLRESRHVDAAGREPETERGQRAANAARRRQDDDRRRRRPLRTSSAQPLEGTF